MRQLVIHGTGLIILICSACCQTSCSGPKSPAGEVLEYMADDPKWPDRQDAGIEKLKAMGS